MEDAQRLWQLEKKRMQDTIKNQKDEMVEDKKWLEKEEKLLVWMDTCSLTYPVELSYTLYFMLSPFLGMSDTCTMIDVMSCFFLGP